MPSIFRTLRFRIAAAFFLWTGLIQVALFIGLPVARDAYLIDAVDRRLNHMGESLVSAAQAGAPPSDLVATTALRSADPSALQVRIEGPDGAVLATSEGARELPRADRAGHVTAKMARDGQEEADRYRLATFEAQVPGGGIEHIEVAQSLAAADGITRSVQRVLMTGLVLGLLGSAGAGWVVSGAIVSRI